MPICTDKLTLLAPKFEYSQKYYENLLYFIDEGGFIKVWNSAMLLFPLKKDVMTNYVLFIVRRCFLIRYTILSAVP